MKESKFKTYQASQALVKLNAGPATQIESLYNDRGSLRRFLFRLADVCADHRSECQNLLKPLFSINLKQLSVASCHFLISDKADNW